MPTHDSPRASIDKESGTDGNLEEIFKLIKSKEKTDPMLYGEVGTVYDTAVKGSGGGCVVM